MKGRQASNAEHISANGRIDRPPTSPYVCGRFLSLYENWRATSPVKNVVSSPKCKFVYLQSEEFGFRTNEHCLQINKRTCEISMERIIP